MLSTTKIFILFALSTSHFCSKLNIREQPTFDNSFAMLTSATLKSLVYTCLTAQQQEASAGRFSDPSILSDDEVAVCNSYFNNPNETIS
jgi:hypothetical protein